MRIQRFKGVLVYVNNVERGQPEVYVVLEEAQIGIRIRESYAIDIDRLPNYQESMGMLDIALSVPPQYGVRPDGDKTRETQFRDQYQLPRVQGLLRPFPDQTAGTGWDGLKFSDVNSESIRQQIITNYRVPGSGEPGSDINLPSNYGNIPTSNMFTSSKDEDKKFDVFPEASMRSEGIYKTAPEFTVGSYRFHPVTGVEVTNLVTRCRDLENRPIGAQPLQGLLYEQYGRKHCPDHPNDIVSLCGENVPCYFDYTMMNARTLGEAAMVTWDSFTLDRTYAIKQYNSCGPINIEYPEYMMKVPAMSSAYLSGDSARFECAQSHWIKGDYKYKCGLVADYNRQYDYRYEWGKGEQPWCRSREKENFLKWLAAILGMLGIILVILMIFMLCWCVKENHKKKHHDKRAITPSNYPAYSRGYYPPKRSSMDDTASQPFLRDSHTPNPPKQPLITPMSDPEKEPIEVSTPSTPLTESRGGEFHGLTTGV
ncbi:hypothetical protein L596_006015 [Steinernema carpocapsae]|uniref:AMOP domain-containing protein n=1 Tax=Steinernema carpocapsae TaxID=34508 RepID=A0A4U8V2A4_STECR|nr:hypothetical protein L596_006015 [Steinernema carpocapsae]